MTDSLVVPPRSIRRYGWKPSLPGVLARLADTSGLPMLPEVDPRLRMPSVFNQLALGSCTANATGAAFQYDAMLDGKLKATDYLSRLWIYWQERRLEGSLGQGDTGAMGSDAFIAAAQVGVPSEKDWPYNPARFDPAKPPAKALKDAHGHYLLTKPTHVVDQSEVAFKQVLSNQQTIAVGFTVYSSFEDDSLWVKGRMPVPKRGEQVLGGHEVLVVGYLEAEPEYALLRNSWGPEWNPSYGGYFLMPWSIITNRRVVQDCRTIVRTTLPVAA